MRANIFHFLVIVTALCLTLTNSTPIQGSGSEASGYGDTWWGISASAYVEEVEVRDGVNKCTEQKAYAYVRGNLYVYKNGEYYPNSGSYSLGAEMDGGYRDSDGNYYSGELRDKVKVARHLHGHPNNHGGWGDSDASVYGPQGLYAQDNDHANF